MPVPTHHRPLGSMSLERGLINKILWKGIQCYSKNKNIQEMLWCEKIKVNQHVPKGEGVGREVFSSCLQPCDSILHSKDNLGCFPTGNTGEKVEPHLCLGRRTGAIDKPLSLLTDQVQLCGFLDPGQMGSSLCLTFPSSVLWALKAPPLECSFCPSRGCEPLVQLLELSP